jgi:serine/threonine protein kinase
MPIHNSENNLADTEKSTRTETVIPERSRASQVVISTKELKNDLEMYEILAVLGHGAAGIVYKAVHKKLGRQVAIKMLKPEYFRNPVILDNFRKEAQIISRIKHGNVASVYDFMEVNGHYYLVMEMVPGSPLSSFCKKESLSEKEILRIMLGLLEGIRYSHNKNILHLDLKPSNILLNDYGEPVIVDFGISRFKAPETGEDEQTPVFGTPYYMAPEQYLRRPDLIDYRTDIYSIGVVFYQLLSGRLPFKGKDFQDIRNKVLLEEPTRLTALNPDISPVLEAIVFKMMRKNAPQRYADAQSVIDDIKRYQSGEPVKAHKYRMVFLVWNWILRNRAVSALSFLVLIVGITFLFYFSYKKRQETPQWKKIYTENFNQDFSEQWRGYRDILKGYLTPIEGGNFEKFFCNRIKVASFKKDLDLTLTSARTFDENIRMQFKWTVNPGPESRFGFFVNAVLSKNELGYIVYFHNDQVSLIRDNISNTPLWSGEYSFESDKIYDLMIEVMDGKVMLHINGEPIFEFQDFITWFSKKEYRVGFFAQSVDIEIDDIKISQLNTALLITPLDIGNRFFQIERFKESVEEYSRVITKYPDHKIAMEAYYLRGLAYSRLGEYIKAIRDFDHLLSRTLSNSLRGKSFYQKGVCLLKQEIWDEAFRNFNAAIKVYDIPSLRSNIVDTIVSTANERLKNPSPDNVADAEKILEYLLSLDVPSRITFVEIPKQIVRYYFADGRYEKAVKTLDFMIHYYSYRKDLLAFALWKKGRAYLELSEMPEQPKKKVEAYQKKAIGCYKQVLLKCPEIKTYVQSSCEDIAKIYRAMGDFLLANEYLKGHIPASELNK